MSNFAKLNNGINTPKQSFDELFGGKHEYIKHLHLIDLVPFPDQHIFDNYSDTKFSELVENIRANDLFQPIIVRPVIHNGNNVYQILAGHHRARAYEYLHKEKIPAIIKEGISDEEASIIFTDTNLNQREKLSIKEKAFAYKLQYDSVKKQGNRNDLSENANAPTGFEESTRQIRRYIRLTELVDNIMHLINNNSLPMMAGVNLSYITQEEQFTVFNYISSNNISLSVSDSETIKRFSSELGEVITFEVLDKIFTKEVKSKPSKEPTINFSIPSNLLSTDTTDIKKLIKDEAVLKELSEVIDNFFNGII